MSFLSATGGSFVSRLDQSVGEQFLSQYIKTVLLMDESVVNLGRAIVTNVQLKHVASLYDELTSMTNLDPLAKVSSPIPTTISPSCHARPCQTSPAP